MMKPITLRVRSNSVFQMASAALALAFVAFDAPAHSFLNASSPRFGQEVVICLCVICRISSVRSSMRPKKPRFLQYALSAAASIRPSVNRRIVRESTDSPDAACTSPRITGAAKSRSRLSPTESAISTASNPSTMRQCFQACRIMKSVQLTAP